MCFGERKGAMCAYTYHIYIYILYLYTYDISLKKHIIGYAQIRDDYIEMPRGASSGLLGIPDVLLLRGFQKDLSHV